MILIQGLVFPSVSSCKDIIACGDATKGEYNLLLKVRDPSRPGFQVLCMIPKGYEYVYHHPWTGETFPVTTAHKYIGVTSRDDVPPNIVKSGMVLTDAGIAFGDADSLSRWVNPSKYSWDDFDWIRYACEQAETSQEAVDLLTTDVVDAMHAPGVSENLFVVGSDRGYIVEADAVQYHIKEITDGYDVISNYPRELWKTQYLKTLPIASAFDSEKEKIVIKGDTIRLNSIQGIRIVDVEDTWINVKQIPFFSFITYENGKPSLITEPVKITIGKRETVGDYSVTLLDIDSSGARVHIETVQHAWQKQMENIIEQHYGSITVQDLMNWSRLNESMVDGLRPMCEQRFTYEGSAIYKIPTEYSSILSNGWFSANHAHSSIFVPFHICNTDIFDPYETGEAAALCSQLSQTYSDRLLPIIQHVETVFISENQRIESWAIHALEREKDISDVLTISDVSMQNQAWLMLQICNEIQTFTNESIQNDLLTMFEGLYDTNYSVSLHQMRDVFLELQSPEQDVLQTFLKQITLDICESAIEFCHVSNITCTEAEDIFEQGSAYLSLGLYEEGFDLLILSYFLATNCFYKQTL